MFISYCFNPSKTDPSGEICTCPTRAKPYFLSNTHPHNWFLCLLPANLKMSINISNWSFIWKYKRYARKSQNDAATNQIQLKTLTQREWHSRLRHCRFSISINTAKFYFSLAKTCLKRENIYDQYNSCAQFFDTSIILLQLLIHPFSHKQLQ